MHLQLGLEREVKTAPADGLRKGSRDCTCSWKEEVETDLQSLQVSAD